MRYPARHTSEGGAGYLSPISGTLLNILDKVLVDGYTDNGENIQSLGWSRPFPRNLDCIAYRPGAGTQLFFKIGDNQAAQSYRVCSIAGYETMADLDTGFGPWGSMYFGKVCGIDPLEQVQYSPAWWIVGDSSGFYLLIGDHESFDVDADKGVPVVMHYLGDFDSLEAGDGFNTLILAHTDATILPSAAASSFFKQWGVHGNVVSCGKVYSEAAGGAISQSIGLLSPQGGRSIGTTRAFLDPLNLVIGNSTPRLSPVLLTHNGADAPRGKMPGLYNVWPPIAGKTGDTFANAANDTFMIVNMQITAGNWEQYAIQLNAW
jgi:hypothetical protein